MKAVSKLLVLAVCLVVLWGCGTGENPAETSGGNGESQMATGTDGLENGEWTGSVGGRQVHYVVAGEGPPCIVLTNSWGLNYKPLRAMFKPLEELFTMVYFDARGMGESGAIAEDSDMSMAAVREDALALLDHLGVEKTYVLGWSNGASNTYLFAGENDDRIIGSIAVHGLEKVTVEDIQYMNKKNEGMMDAYTAYMEQINNPDVSPEEKKELHHRLYMEWFPTMLADKEANLEAVNQVFAEADFSYEHALYSYVNDQQKLDATESLEKVTKPMLIIAGAHDSAPVESYQRAADVVEGSTFVVFENSGHFSPIEEPEKFMETVKSFIESTK